MAEKVPAGQVSLGDLAALAATVGGTRGRQVTTTSPGDITALQQALAGLQSADYEALLQSIFQKAGAEIPGLQAATGRAVGARTYNNSAAQMAMQELLKATTLAAQEKIVAQQLQNQQAQVQAGQAIAQATKGTTQATTEKKGLDLGRTAAILALMQGLSKLQGMDFSKMFAGGTGAGAGAMAGGISSPAAAAAPTVTMAPATTAAPAMATPLSSGPGPVQQLVTALTSPFMAVNNIVESLRNPTIPVNMAISEPASWAVRRGNVTTETPFAIPGEEGFSPVAMGNTANLFTAPGSGGLTYNPDVWEL